MNNPNNPANQTGSAAPPNDVRLMIKTFGALDILCGGQTIFIPKQNSGKINSLFQYFIIHNNKPCVPETVMETLWPDNEYIDERKVLHTYIHRIKSILTRENALGMDFTDHISILNIGGSYMLKTTNQVSYDVHLLDDLIASVSGAKTKEDIWAALNRLFELYPAHFLQDSGHDQLVLRIRNKYLRRCAEAVSILMEKLLLLDLHEDVVNAAEQYFNIDDVDEDINYWYIRSLLALGRDNHASRHFKYIQDKMRTALDISPSDRMLALFGKKRSEAIQEVLESGDIRQFLDDAHIKAMINDIVSERMALDASKTQYTFVRIDADSGLNGVTDTMFASAIIKSLRRNDMYAILDDHTALILLHDAGEEHFSIIRQRILRSASALFEEAGVAVSVGMWKAIKVL
jgi:DNA-binding SARP family transcriptional activator